MSFSESKYSITHLFSLSIKANIFFPFTRLRFFRIPGLLTGIFFFSTVEARSWIIFIPLSTPSLGPVTMTSSSPYSAIPLKTVEFLFNSSCIWRSFCSRCFARNRLQPLGSSKTLLIIVFSFRKRLTLFSASETSSFFPASCNFLLLLSNMMLRIEFSLSSSLNMRHFSLFSS